MESRVGSLPSLATALMQSPRVVRGFVATPLRQVWTAGLMLFGQRRITAAWLFVSTCAIPPSVQGSVPIWIHVSCSNPTRSAHIPVDVEVADEDVPVDVSEVVDVPVLADDPVDDLIDEPVDLLEEVVAEDEEDPLIGSNVALPESDDDVDEDVPSVVAADEFASPVPVEDEEEEVVRTGPVLLELLDRSEVLIFTSPVPDDDDFVELVVVVVLLLLVDDLDRSEVLMLTAPVPDDDDSVELVVGEPLQASLVLGSTRRSVIGVQSALAPASP